MVFVEMGWGDVLIYFGKIVYGGGVNVIEDLWCNVVYFSFLLGWLILEEFCFFDFIDDELCCYLLCV